MLRTWRRRGAVISSVVKQLRLTSLFKIVQRLMGNTGGGVGVEDIIWWGEAIVFAVLCFLNRYRSSYNEKIPDGAQDSIWTVT